VLAWWWLHEIPGLQVVAGSIIVVLSVVAAQILQRDPVASRSADRYRK